MDIEKNFDKNTKTAIKKNQHRLPPGSKFVLQQLLKNSHHIEENLDKEEVKEGNPPGEVNVTGTYNDVFPSYTFRSQGPIPGRMEGSGYNFESQGPVGVDYFATETEDKESLYEFKIKTLKNAVKRTLNEKSGRICGNDDSDCGGGQCCYHHKCQPCETGRGINSSSKKRETIEATTTASSGAYSTPKFWSKDKKNQRFATQRWMPDAKYVKVKDKCKKFPYCNQGDINALELWEKDIMKESAKKVSKKTGLPEKEVRKMIEKEIKEIIRRGFYKSPIKDLVGTGKMKTPIGKIFTMSGNKPKYES